MIHADSTERNADIGEMATLIHTHQIYPAPVWGTGSGRLSVFLKQLTNDYADIKV